MKTALVTGASRGIGKAILEKFVNEGIFVIGTYNSSLDEALAVQDKFGKNKVKFVKYNQGDLSSLDTLLEETNRPIDILVNNAGLGSKTVENVATEKEEQDSALFKVNALGLLWLTEKIIDLMQNNDGGKIINISSVGGGIFHYPGFRLADGMSKAAVAFMSKQLAAEHVHTNIDIFAICPGATETDMFEESTLKSLNEADRKSFIENLPKKRLISPNEIADLCYYLTTGPAQILHGAVLDSSLGLGSNPGLLK